MAHQDERNTEKSEMRVMWIMAHYPWNDGP